MVAEFAPEPTIEPSQEPNECERPNLTLLVTPEEPETLNYMSHRRLHGICYKTECVERFGMPLDTALGSALLRHMW